MLESVGGCITCKWTSLSKAAQHTLLIFFFTESVATVAMQVSVIVMENISVEVARLGVRVIDWGGRRLPGGPEGGDGGGSGVEAPSAVVLVVGEVRG